MMMNLHPKERDKILARVRLGVFKKWLLAHKLHYIEYWNIKIYSSIARFPCDRTDFLFLEGEKEIRW